MNPTDMPASYFLWKQRKLKQEQEQTKRSPIRKQQQKSPKHEELRVESDKSEISVPKPEFSISEISNDSEPLRLAKAHT